VELTWTPALFTGSQGKASYTLTSIQVTTLFYASTALHSFTNQHASRDLAADMAVSKDAPRRKCPIPNLLVQPQLLQISTDYPVLSRTVSVKSSLSISAAPRSLSSLCPLAILPFNTHLAPARHCRLNALTSADHLPRYRLYWPRRFQHSDDCLTDGCRSDCLHACVRHMPWP
jgi:hypothetical protein